MKVIDIIQGKLDEYITTFCMLEKNKGKVCCFSKKENVSNCAEELKYENVINFDEFSKDYHENSRWCQATPASCDALKCYDDKVVFIDYKNNEFMSAEHSKTIGERQEVIQNKIIGSIKTIFYFSKKCTDIAKKNTFIYYVVSNSSDVNTGKELYELLEYSSILDKFVANRYQVKLEDVNTEVKANGILNCSSLKKRLSQYEIKNTYPE